MIKILLAQYNFLNLAQYKIVTKNYFNNNLFGNMEEIPFSLPEHFEIGNNFINYKNQKKKINLNYHLFIKIEIILRIYPIQIYCR